MYNFQPTLDVFKSKSNIAVTHSYKVIVVQATPIMMKSDQHVFISVVLGKMNEASVTMLQDVVDQFLYNTENKQFLFRLKPDLIIVKPAVYIY
jgi:hypothetical protein